MSKLNKELPPRPKSGGLGLEVTADMKEFGELVSAAQGEEPAKRLSDIIDWHDENESEYAGDVKQKAKALLAAKTLLNGHGGFGKLVPPIGRGAGAHTKKAEVRGATAESEPQNKS